MIHDTDPYIILGLPRDATFEQIRIRYKQLAKQHHPDKWSNIDSQSEEYRFHEEEFKKITVAYHVLEEEKVHGNYRSNTSTSTSSNTSPSGNGRTKEEWNDIWKRMEDLLAKKNILSHLSNLFKVAVEEVGKTRISQHHFTVPVTLEEITAKKRKKIRLFLKDNPEPFYVTFPCENYPEYETAVVRNNVVMQVKLHMKALPHERYEVDEIIEGELDLFCTLRLNLYDYFNGKSLTWTHLDGREIQVDIPPLCGKHQGYIWQKMDGYGLLGKGSLYISVEWSLPTQSQWVHISLLNQENFLDVLNIIYSEHPELPDHSGA